MRRGVISGGRVLTGDSFARRALAFDDGVVVADPACADGKPGWWLDAQGLLVCPGCVDLQGHAVEQQVLPRAGGGFALDLVLCETDRRLAANGITTAYHAMAWAAAPGARGGHGVRAVRDALALMGDALAVDTRLHVHHEADHIEAEPDLLAWMAEGRVDLLSFSDQRAAMTRALALRAAAPPLRRAGRGLGTQADHAVLACARALGEAVPGSVERLAAQGRRTGTIMISHDDASPDQRTWFHERGVTIAGFPLTVGTAERAKREGAAVMLAAPDVLRADWSDGVDAADLATDGLCTVLASRDYYPALPLAPFRLAETRHLDLAETWTLVSKNPAEAAGLKDRGTLDPGKRADIVLIDPLGPVPRVVATFVAGQLVHIAEPARLH